MDKMQRRDMLTISFFNKEMSDINKGIYKTEPEKKNIRSRMTDKKRMMIIT